MYTTADIIEIQTTLEEYRLRLDEFLESDDYENLVLENQTISDALKTQVRLSIRVGGLRSNLSSLKSYAEDRVDFFLSSAFKKLSETSPRKLSPTEMKHFAVVDSDYIAARKALSDVASMKYEVDSLWETVESRKYILNSYANLIVNDSAGYIL